MTPEVAKIVYENSTLEFRETHNSLYQLCHDMWSWLAKTGSTKDIWEREFPKQAAILDAHATCAACKMDYYTSTIYHAVIRRCCQFCPIQWTPNHQNCEHPDSPYTKWSYSYTTDERKTHASEVLHLVETTWREL